jgi:glycosyltransferase involved in cell wall biosynthesis
MPAAGRPIKLAALISHPIQYIVPLLQRLASRPEVDLTVFYMSEVGLKPAVVEGLGETFVWDIPLLEGYRYRFLRNFSPHPHRQRPTAKLNLGIATELLLGRFDALYLHGYVAATEMLAFGCAKALRMPILFHGDTVLDSNSPRPAWLRENFRRQFTANIDAALAMSGRARAFYQHYGVPEERIFWSPLAVDNERWMQEARARQGDREAALQELGLDPSLPTLLHVSLMRPVKRPKDLLLAFEQLKTPANLVMVGGGPLFEELQTYCREKALERVKFVGPQNMSTLGRYYALASVFVLPSEHEVNPLTVREAMCFGLPVITSDRVQSAADFIQEGHNGFTFRMGNVAELAAKIDEVIADPERTAQMGAKSLELIQPWNYDVGVNGIIEALAAVVPRRAR